MLLRHGTEMLVLRGSYVPFQGDAMEDAAAEMAAMDLNKDGIATLEEIEIFMRETYYNKEWRDAQTEEGKAVTSEEVNAIVRNEAKQLLSYMDSDGSNSLSIKEVTESFKNDDVEDEVEDTEVSKTE